MLDDDDILDPNDDPADDPKADPEDSHEDPFVPSVKHEDDDEPQFDASIGTPSVLGEENPFGGDATDSESPDIDKALADVGLGNDDDGIKPLGEE